jgi:hypothetical protein
MYDNILNDYEKVNQCNLQYISEADQFNKFLLYGLFYTSFTHEVNIEKRILIDYLKTQHTPIYEAAQAEFKEKTNQANFTEDLNTSGIVLFDSFSELYDSTKSFIKAQSFSLQIAKKMTGRKFSGHCIIFK